MDRIVLHPEVLRELRHAPGVRQHLERVGEVVVERARARVHVDDGDTRDSIHTETVETPDGVEVRVVAINRFLELGTKRSRAFPFLRPALESVKGRR